MGCGAKRSEAEAPVRIASASTTNTSGGDRGVPVG
jgi:hypothetical protein